MAKQKKSSVIKSVKSKKLTKAMAKKMTKKPVVSGVPTPEKPKIPHVSARPATLYTRVKQENFDFIQSEAHKAGISMSIYVDQMLTQLRTANV